MRGRAASAARPRRSLPARLEGRPTISGLSPAEAEEVCVWATRTLLAAEM